MNFYTNVQCLGNNILYRGIIDGKRVKQRIEYEPALFIRNKQGSFHTLEGFTLKEERFESIRAARDFIKGFDGVHSAPKIYGNTRFEYAYIGEEHPGTVQWEQEKILIGVIDIEVGSENGFPDPYEANEPITAIAIKYIGGKTYVFGCGDYDNNDKDVVYVKCKDEWTLCKRFIMLWERETPDVITGWNIKFFDVPYLVNRFKRILGEDQAVLLSPWKKINERQVHNNNRTLIAYELLGLASLDYIELYKWYAPNGKSKESYRLDAIASEEVGENKLSYDEFDNLHQLYRLNYQKFIEYNIKDVELILKLEDKLKLLELALTLAYDTKCNYEDVFAQTRMWDALTYNNLMEKNIVVPPREVQDKDSAFEGAYVKEPLVGMHRYVASFDLDSLYPHLMMQYNISPETLISPENYTEEMRRIISEGINVEKLLNKEIDTSKLVGATLTPNGQFYRTDFQGFLPKMMEEMYEDRKKFKRMMLDAKQEYEKETDKTKLYDIEKRIARYNNLQLAKKVSLNSAYGALGSQYFRFYDLRNALGVTTAGQLSIRWIQNKLNGYMNKLLSTDKDYVIASDTDSIYLNLGPLVEKVYGSSGTVSMPTLKVIEFMDRVCESKIRPFIDQSYQELAEYVHAYTQKMRMKREALSDRAIWTAKKRYIMNVYDNEGVRYNEPDLKVMGLEMIKSSTPAAVREKMKESIRIIMSGTEEDMHKFIAEFNEKFKSLPPEEISFPRGVNGLTKYADSVTLYKLGTPIHVKGAILYNHYLKEKNLTKKYPLIQEGEKIKFSYLKSPNPFKDTVISYPSRLPKEFELDSFIDYNTQFEKTFLEPLKIILDCINWTTEKQSTLDAFFN